MEIEAIEMPLTWYEKLSALEVNQGIPIENKKSIRVMIHKYFRKTRRKFSIRTIKETGEVRVWRIR